MRRSVIIPAVIAALMLLAFLIAPVVTGVVAERSYQQVLDRIDSDPSLQVRSSRYDRGYWTSRSEVDVEVRGELGDAFSAAMEDAYGDRQSLAFQLSDTIRHGPLTPVGGWIPGAARVDSEVAVAPDIAERITALADDPVVLRAETRIDLDGGSYTAFRMPDRDITMDAASLRFSGVHGTLRADAALEQAEMLTVVDDLALMEGDITWSVHGARFTARMDDLRSRLWTGESTLEVDVASANDLEFEGLRLQSDAGVDAGLLEAFTELTVHAVILDGYRIGESRLALRFENLDQSSMEQIIALSDELELGHIDEQTLGFRFLGLLPDLLVREPAITLEDFSMDLPEGLLEARARVEWRGDPPSMDNPFAALNGLFVDLELMGPEAAVQQAMGGYMRLQLEAGAEAAGRSYDEEQLSAMVAGMTRQQISGLVGDGMLERDDQRLRGQLVIEDGLVVVNGRSFGPVWSLLPALSR